MKMAVSSKIKYYNFFFTVIIVACHARELSGFDFAFTNMFDEWLLNKYVSLIGGMTVAALVFFFFMSGFWFYQNTVSLQDVKRKCLKRLNTLLVPYLLWTAIAMLYHFVINSNVDLNVRNWINLCFFDPINSPLWYLLALLIFQVLSPLLILTKNTKLSMLFYIGVVICYILKNIGIIPLIELENWWWCSGIVKYFPVYITGAYVGMYCPEIVLEYNYNDKKYNWSGAFLVLLSYYLWEKCGQSQFETLYLSLGVVGSWLLLNVKYFEKNIPKIYSCSFYIYAMHQPMLVMSTNIIINKLFNGIPVNGYEGLLIKIIQVLIIVVSAYVTKNVFRRIMPSKLYECFSGGRSV